MEYWNVEDPVFSGNGIMGFGEMVQWLNCKFVLDMKTINIQIRKFLLKCNIPIFHHSILPCAMENHQVSRKTI